MRQKIHQFIEKEMKLTPGTKLIAGVSGGADSVVMLHILNDLGYDCIVAHCNFHLRGEESDRDEKVVENWAKRLQLPFEKVDFDTSSYAKENKLSIEMAARELRYHWFEKIRQKHHAEYISVAHHADDSAETLLMNLIRGTGLRGLKGIEAINGKIIRPMLCCSRNEIETYAESNRLNFITDSTNANTDFVRNKIRLETIPSLAEINPSIKQTLTETADRLLGAWKVYEQTIEKIKSEITSIKNDRLYIHIKKLQQQADVRTVLFELLQPYQFHSDVVKQIAESLEDNSGLTFHSSEHTLLKDREYLILTKNAEIGNDFTEILIQENTTEILTPISLSFKKMEKNEPFVISKHPKKIHLNYYRLKFPLTIRKWRSGDVFKPFGMNHFKKISDYLIDQKVDVITKQNTFVITSDDEIVCILGMRTDNRYKVDENATTIWEINVNF